MLQRKQQMRGKAHYSPKCVVRPPFSLFTCLAKTQQAKETLVPDPGVVSLHVNACDFPTSARQAQHLTYLGSLTSM